MKRTLRCSSQCNFCALLFGTLLQKLAHKGCCSTPYGFLHSLVDPNSINDFSKALGAAVPSLPSPRSPLGFSPGSLEAAEHSDDPSVKQLEGKVSRGLCFIHVE